MFYMAANAWRRSTELSEHEKQAWASMIASVLIWSFFASRITDGGAVGEVAARHLLVSYAAVVVLMIVAQSVIATVLTVRAGGVTLKDERDVAIEASADRVEGYVVLVAINVLVIHALADAAWPVNSLPRVDLGSVPTLVFALITTLFAGHVARQVATIWMYRR